MPTSGVRALASSATVAAACATLVFAAACGGSTPHQSHAPSPSPASGKVRIHYDDAQTPEAQRGRQLMRDAKLLEDLAAYVEDSVLLPADMTAVAKQCDAVNDFYNPASNELLLCYESIQHSEQNFAASGKPNPAIGAIDAETSGFYHELGHAILHIYDLAFTGREEDVADQLSAFMLLTPGADGKPYPNGVRIATDTAQDWKLSAKEAGDANELPFWDGHPMDLQRMYNWECWIYGSDPRANTGIVTSGDLPEDRAGKCEKEFQNMARAWQQMLGPHLRKPS